MDLDVFNVRCYFKKMIKYTFRTARTAFIIIAKLVFLIKILKGTLKISVNFVTINKI